MLLLRLLLTPLLPNLIILLPLTLPLPVLLLLLAGRLVLLQLCNTTNTIAADSAAAVDTVAAFIGSFATTSADSSCHCFIGIISLIPSSHLLVK
jgi:hypothetical protein